MATNEILASYISKLGHPLKEIRERALQLLTAKLQLGWELDDELAGTRRLLEALLLWLQGSRPTLQREVLELLLTTIKTKSGAYITKEFGIRKILSNLNASKDKIAPDAMEAYNDVMETLRFINTVESEENITIPKLSIPDTASSGSASSSGYYNLDANSQTSKKTSVSYDDCEITKQISNKKSDGIKVLLFPWVNLCQSDSKTMLLIEDALRLLKSTRRCCRFICDVFLRDFPVEIFLNRPGIIKNLVAIAEGSNGSRPNEALHVLLCITNALRKRLLQLSSLDVVHEADELSDDHKDIENEVNIELEQIVDGVLETPKEDGLAALRQLPAPLYALDTLNAVLSIMARSLVDLETLNLKELNLCICLVESLVELLLDCVTDKFWTSDHNFKTHRDIAHKSCMVMRLLGDLLIKYSKYFYENPDRVCHRVAWLRLVLCSLKLLHLVRESAMPPASIVAALQAVQIDPAVDLFYPDLSQKIAAVLKSTKIPSDQEYKTKYKQLKKVCASMEEAVKFMKNKESCRNTKDALNCIKTSLPVLEIFQSESFLTDIADYLLLKTRNFDLNDSDWTVARSIALNLMANNVEWVSAKFYGFLAEMVKSVLIGDEAHQVENEKCLTLLCDVSILTEICCHGLCSKSCEVKESASEIILYLLRGRMALSDSCWWRLLASVLPVLPLLHVYAAHETLLGQAICKSLERDIAECMGVSRTERMTGLVRLVFVKCVAVQLDAAHSLCRLLDDDRFLPPRDSLRADVLLNALRRLEPHEFNIDFSSSPTKTPQATGLTQILDVLKQDIILDEHGAEYVTRSTLQPSLEPSLRRNTLQQLSVMMRQQDLHETFLQYDGLKVTVAILRMSLMVEDYLAFPECAISCVSVLNSICFASRHNLAKISDLPSLLIRVILVFPANESAVLLSAQVLSLLAWAGFALQELDASRHRVPALPLSVTERTALPFKVNSYWNSSPNAEHSYVEWLLAEEAWRTSIRVHWWCANVGRTKVLLEAPPPPAPLALRPCARDLALLRATCPVYSCSKALLDLENATSHRQVTDALNILESYTYLMPLSSATSEQLGSLPWQHMKRFFSAPPASSRDAMLLTSLLHFVLAYMNNVPAEDVTMSWIKSSFIGNEASIISLLSRTQLYPQQTPQENIEVTQVQIHIIKVLIRCIVSLEGQGDYDSNKMESLLKILLACLERIDLKNFHMLGYLNELMRCIRYVLNSRFCFLSEETLIHCLKITSLILSGCASGGGRKGQACRLDAMLSLLALLKQIHEEAVPVQRWSEVWTNEVVYSVVKCTRGARAELRAASLHVFAALAYYAQLLPHLMQAIDEQSLSQFAAQIFSLRSEANAVRAAAASLLSAVCSRASSKSDVLERDVLEQLEANNFIENCLDALVNFNNSTEYVQSFEPNISLSVLERRSELEVRAQKCGDVLLSPTLSFQGNVPPTASLIVRIADLLTNVSAFKRCPVQEWNERGLYRLLFRCASWQNGPLKEVYRIRTAVCCSLVAVTSHKCVRLSLSSTKDCLNNLMSTLTPFGEEELYPDCFAAKSQALLLLASLLVERSTVDSVWGFLKDEPSNLLFLLLQCLESDETELQDSGLYCLTRLTQSAMNKKHADKTKDESCMKFYDKLKSPFDRSRDSYCSGDIGRNDDCQPEYMTEEFCKALMNLYNKISLENKKYQTNEDERWSRVCSCIASVAACSSRGRLYYTHRQFPRTLLCALHAVRDQLSVRGKPVDALRHADTNPVLRTLYWLLTVMDCSMSNCSAAKESYADENMVASLNRLWVWCMMTDQLRNAVMHLLFTFTNECSKAWGAMCVCVGGHSLIGEVCALCVRETSLQSRPRSDALLLLSLHTIRHCVPHHHCRSLILKSEVMSSMYKLSVRDRVRGGGAGVPGAGTAWAALCNSLAAHADGSAALLAGTGALAALAVPLRARLLPAVAHAASHHRVTFLQSPDLLELLSGTLLSGDTAEIISAARAVWALAANNHKAKLLLRSAGVAAAVQSTLQRVMRAPRDPTSERMLQILTYTNTVLQTT